MSTDSGEADNAPLDAYLAACQGAPPASAREMMFDASSGMLREYQTAYDEIIRDRSNIQWINVLFGRGGDLKVRNWNLWEISQTSSTAWLSPQLLLQVEMEAAAGKSAIDNVSRYLAHRERRSRAALGLLHRRAGAIGGGGTIRPCARFLLRRRAPAHLRGR